MSASSVPTQLVLPDLAADETLAPTARLAALAAAARDCRACPLWQLGRQTVFGEGPAEARLLVLGEAPGEQEDLQGRPLVGPSGQLFNQALEQAGLNRAELFITNTVKHRPWVAQGRRQKNRAPKQSEINACRPWLEQQLTIVRPALILCLGATAAQAILGREFRLTRQRGQWQPGPADTAVLATVHPAYVLIQPPESQEQVKEQFFAGFRRLAERYQAG
jgi:uracil-DNA glycosylase